MTAQSLVRDDDAAEFHAIGPFNDEGQRHAERGGALRASRNTAVR